jgi:cation diffusion facilitator family transporter
VGGHDSIDHDHAFGLHEEQAGERRTRRVAGLTAAFMVLECAAGVAFGSMALLADGLHMASHAAALGLAAAAYAYARRRARDPRYSFGTGKVSSLAGFTSAVVLVLFAALMAYESVVRLLEPVPIAVDQALVVAVLGLAVNGASALMLGHGDGGRDHHHEHGHNHQEHDHNLLAARLHVLADALTSVLAIVALLAARYLGATWMDPLMGIVGAALVLRWGFGLMRAASAVLLDRQAPPSTLAAVRGALEREGRAEVVDLHVWSVGPGVWAADVALCTDSPRPPSDYRGLLPPDLGLVHVTVEVRERAGSARPRSGAQSSPPL